MKSVMDSTTVSESECCSIPNEAMASNINRRIAKPVYREWPVSVVLMDSGGLRTLPTFPRVAHAAES